LFLIDGIIYPFSFLIPRNKKKWVLGSSKNVFNDNSKYFSFFSKQCANIPKVLSAFSHFKVGLVAVSLVAKDHDMVENVASSSELRSSSTLSRLVARVGVVPELRYACSGLFKFNAFGVSCCPHKATM
jgi:hypothetical protein